MRKQKSYSGFTLIELLVVMAVVLALAGLIFPVVARTRAKARQTACLSNIHQISLAMEIYSQDNSEQYPWAADMIDLHTTLWNPRPQNAQVHSMPILWKTLAPFTGSNTIWRCPADTGYDKVDIYSTPTNPMILAARPTCYDAFGMSYLYNTALPLTYQKVGMMSGIRYSSPEIQRNASEIFVLVDSCGSWHGDTSQRRYNVLMGDNHVVYETGRQFDDTLNTILDASNPIL